MSGINKQAQLRICELEELVEEMLSLDEESEEYIIELQGENWSLRMMLWQYHIDRGFSESPRSVPQPSLH